MNLEEEKDRKPSAEGTKRKAKKPYVKPAVRHERVFETMALSCGKVQTTDFDCHFNRKSS